MTIGLFFWILMIFWLVIGLYHNWPQGDARNFWPVGGNLLLFLLIFLLGVATFGWPIKG